MPVLLQPSYVPDGWLGILVGARLYIDLSTEEKLDTNIPRLIKELGKRGRYTSQTHLESPREHSDRESNHCIIFPPSKHMETKTIICDGAWENESYGSENRF